MLHARRHRIVLFLLLTYGLSSIFYVLIASTGKMQALPVFGLMWCPGIAALILRLALQGNLAGTGWAWPSIRWQLLSYLLPPALGLAVYGTVWITGIGSFDAAGLAGGRHGPMPVAGVLAVLATLGFISGAVFALGEELGWRGYLVPELSQITSFTRTAWISGAAWSVYHYPLILFANYNSGTQVWFALAAFTWMVMALSFVYAWVRLKSRSLWPAVFLHASHNLYIQQVFDPLTKDGRITKYVTTEFGLGLAIAYTVVAFIATRQKESWVDSGSGSLPSEW